MTKTKMQLDMLLAAFSNGRIFAPSQARKILVVDDSFPVLKLGMRLGRILHVGHDQWKVTTSKEEVEMALRDYVALIEQGKRNAATYGSSKPRRGIGSYR